MSRFSLVMDSLLCPVCTEALRDEQHRLRCVAGHSFDKAKQGYVNLRVGSARPARHADSAEMVAARSAFLGAGHYAPLFELLADSTDSAGLVLDAGSGCGEYLAAVLEGSPMAHGLALDLSAPAIRRAAKAHPRAAAVVADLRGRLPLAEGSVEVLLNVFSPRNAAEYRRVLRADGKLLAVTPGQEHLRELVERLELLTVAEDKSERLLRTLEGSFNHVGTRRCAYQIWLDHQAVTELVLMGPSAHHVDRDELSARVAELPDPMPVTASFAVSTFTPS